MDESEHIETPEAFKITEAEKSHQELTRNLYLERRNHIEKTFADNPPNRNIVDLEDGSKIKVLSSIDVLPDNLTSENKSGKLRVSIYVPTLWYTETTKSKEYRENRLASTVLSGDIDVAIQLKAEGMNDTAFLNEDGSGAGQKKVAGSAVDVLKTRLEELGLTDKDIEFSILGYSEGSSQGASIAAQILEKGLGSVKEYVSIGGAGLVGAEKQADANPIKFILSAGASVNKEVPPPQGKESIAPGTGKVVLIEEGPDSYYIPGEVLGQEAKNQPPRENIPEGKEVFQEGSGLELALGKTPEPPIYEGYKPEVEFGGRYALTRAKNLAEKMLNQEFNPDWANPVPQQRIQAAATLNPDYDYLAEHNVPIIVFTETKDTFFDNKAVRAKTNDLRNRHPNSKIVRISSNAGHEDPWKNPSGLAFALQIIRDKVGLS